MQTALLDGFFKMDLAEGAFYAGFGFLFVFCGIALLIIIFTVLGLIMRRLDAIKRSKKAAAKPKAAETAEKAAAPEIEAGISPETVAAITAALCVALSREGQKCDFIVKRIKRHE